MLKTALAIVSAAALPAAAADVEAGLVKVLGDNSSDVPTVFAGLKKGMSPAEARKVFPALQASVTGAKPYGPGTVPMKDPMLEALELSSTRASSTRSCSFSVAPWTARPSRRPR